MLTSRTEAGKILKLYPQNIRLVLRGKLKTTGGYSFKYVE